MKFAVPASSRQNHHRCIPFVFEKPDNELVQIVSVPMAESKTYIDGGERFELLVQAPKKAAP